MHDILWWAWLSTRAQHGADCHHNVTEPQATENHTRVHRNCESGLPIIGASPREPHTSVTSLYPCVCKFVCLDRPLTVSHSRLLFCASTSSMVTTRMQTTCGLAYSVSRVIEVTTWQSVDAICLCCLTHVFWINAWHKTCKIRTRSDLWKLVGPSKQASKYIHPRCDEVTLV